MYQGIFSSNTKALGDYVHILPWQTNRIFVIAVDPFKRFRGWGRSRRRRGPARRCAHILPPEEYRSALFHKMWPAFLLADSADVHQVYRAWLNYSMMLTALHHKKLIKTPAIMIRKTIHRKSPKVLGSLRRMTAPIKFCLRFAALFLQPADFL